MKIYNKKTFAFGVFSAALGVLNAVTAALRGIDAAGIVLVAVLLFVGAGAMMRGLSQKMAREDKLEERDERNRLVELKSKSVAFRLTQAVCFGLMLPLLVAGRCRPIPPRAARCAQQTVRFPLRGRAPV